MPWPVCARCAGIYGGAAVGTWLAAAAAWPRQGARRTRRAESLRMALLAVAAPTAATWAVERAGWVASSNEVRFWVALPLGALGGWIVASMVTGQVD